MDLDGGIVIGILLLTLIGWMLYENKRNHKEHKKCHKDNKTPTGYRCDYDDWSID